MEIEEEEPINVDVECPVHHINMTYSGFDQSIKGILKFHAQCRICLNQADITMKNL